MADEVHGAARGTRELTPELIPTSRFPSAKKKRINVASDVIHCRCTLPALIRCDLSRVQAIAYYWVLILLWALSPTAAYYFRYYFRHSQFA